jgi:uncharacterized protein (TIRG00374 family)
VSSFRQRAIVCVGFVVSAGLGFVAVRDVKWSATWTALGHSQYVWLAPATGALAVSIAIRVERWRLLFSPERRPPFGAAAKALLLGFLFNIILPLRAGEAVRILALRSYTGTAAAETTATVVIERLFDVLSLLLLLFVSLHWLPHLTWIRAAAVLAVVAVACVVALAVVSAIFKRSRTKRPHTLRRVPFLDDMTVRRLTVSIADGLSALRRPRQAVAAVTLTLVSWLVLAFAFWLMMIAFRLHLPVIASLFVAIMTGLSFVIPSAPGAVGVFEAAGLTVTNAYRVPPSSALAYVLVLHALNVFPFVIAGIAVLAADRRSKRRSSR